MNWNLFHWIFDFSSFKRVLRRTSPQFWSKRYRPAKMTLSPVHSSMCVSLHHDLPHGLWPFDQQTQGLEILSVWTFLRLPLLALHRCIIRGHIKRANAAYKARANKHHKQLEFKPGDLFGSTWGRKDSTQKKEQIDGKKWWSFPRNWEGRWQCLQSPTSRGHGCLIHVQRWGLESLCGRYLRKPFGFEAKSFWRWGGWYRIMSTSIEDNQPQCYQEQGALPVQIQALFLFPNSEICTVLGINFKDDPIVIIGWVLLCWTS